MRPDDYYDRWAARLSPRGEWLLSIMAWVLWAALCATMISQCFAQPGKATAPPCPHEEARHAD